MRAPLTFILLLLLSACAGGGIRPNGDDTPPDRGTPRADGDTDATGPAEEAPWSRSRLARSDVPPVYVTAWEAAENRESCALMAPASLGSGEGATARQAQFSGGWGVAYDLPGTRSAFGVAGTGADISDPFTYEWPNERRWSDGSFTGYGPEGGAGPNQLAYLRIEGQGCLYNIWSRLGLDHLEYLLEQLRFVR